MAAASTHHHRHPLSPTSHSRACARLRSKRTLTTLTPDPQTSATLTPAPINRLCRPSPRRLLLARLGQSPSCPHHRWPCLRGLCGPNLNITPSHQGNQRRCLPRLLFAHFRCVCPSGISPHTYDHAHAQSRTCARTCAHARTRTCTHIRTLALSTTTADYGLGPCSPATHLPSTSNHSPP